MTGDTWIALVVAVGSLGGLAGVLTWYSQRKREPVHVDNLIVEGAKEVVVMQREQLVSMRQDIARLYEQITAERETRERETEMLWVRLTGAYSYVEVLRDHIVSAAPPPPPPYPAGWQTPGPWHMPTPAPRNDN